MKKKSLIALLIIAFVLLLAVGVSASTIYKDTEGNTLFSFEANANNIITSYEGEFPKVDAQGNALTWYVTSTVTEGANTVKTVASVLTLDENYITLNDGTFSYKTNTVTNKNTVSVNFPSDSGITTLNLSGGVPLSIR